MAGPGGGPPRRSHTKSRKGCDTCKKRHIRCDETFPQCRNCTKHKIRCPYHDVPAPDDRSITPDKKPDLMWTPDVEATIRQWLQTGVFPFPALKICPVPAPQLLNLDEMRLIHHVASISDQLDSMGANGFTLWTRRIPLLIKIGATHRYVLDALLAFSAMHIAFVTDCSEVGKLAYVHRGRALSGLHKAIGSFSKETSDAILAASLVLSWQATDWRSWTQLMHGTKSVIKAMDEWKHESQFGDFIAESDTFPTAPASPGPDHKSLQARKEDMDAFQPTMHQLQRVEAHLKHLGGDASSMQHLMNFLKAARKVGANTPVSEQFERLRPLRTWLFWLPVRFLQQTRASATALVIIAHYYTVAMLMDGAFPGIGADYFGSLTIAPVEEIASRLYSLDLSEGDATLTTRALMEYPIDMVNQFRHRMGWTQPEGLPSLLDFNQTNFYMDQHSPASLGGNSPCELPFSPYENSAFSYSTENLSIATTDSSTPATMNPLQLSPPPNAQFLKIPGPTPSPNYRSWSPASSTYECAEYAESSSITYSDKEEFSPYMSIKEEFSPYEVGMCPATPVTGGANMYGLGFVGPLLRVSMSTRDINHHGSTPDLMSSATSTFPPSEAFDFLLSPLSVTNQTQTHPSYHTPSISVTTLPYMESSLAPPMHLGHRRNFSTASAPPTLTHGRTDHIKMEL